MLDPFRVQCNAVNYRQGIIEVIGGIHPGLVNLETFQLHVDVNLSGDDPESKLTDNNYTANTELELTPPQARSLAAALLAAAEEAEQGSEALIF